MISILLKLHSYFLLQVKIRVIC